MKLTRPSPLDIASGPAELPAAGQRVVILGSKDEAVPAVAPGPLKITYTQTRVLPALGARLQRIPGAVRSERSALSETYKQLRGRLLQGLARSGHRVVAICSPRAADGKSLAALNLALAIAAEPDRSVLLVDADLSGTGLQALLHLTGERGLGEHLVHGAALPGLLVNPGVPRCVLLPAGSEGAEASAEWLGSRAMAQLITEARQRYPERLVIVDLPPLLDTADTLAFLPHADTTLLVVEERGTTIEDMETASDLLAPFELVGALMTHPHPKAPERSRARWWRRGREGVAKDAP